MKIRSFGEGTIDTYASGFQYHELCIGKFMNRRMFKSSCFKANEFEETLTILTLEIEEPLL